MFAVVVEFHLRSGTHKDFLSLVEQNAATSLSEETGCHQFDVATDPDRPEAVLLYELYSDADAFAVHLETAHFAAFDAAISDMVADKTISTYRQVKQ